ncbi:tyrosine-protein phosphatase [Microbulbifer hydrolyticus]|uniref:protein-tyrosine-phosphatase n=1 Tax=Microbulbifer hydrolyticus TaxID=48074 RepID=A0A6P1TFX2_9GAMM|nr:CpsB/CapC family capsule biosynthesis tyrosine phosphatase [Microbulbifer hydrolyticus]MBB5211859.1 protein-tyrosine phosphatase [Microbulbifer hydrolyticus]QHQ40553.1 capsular biosynthesis protein [Microbulbifer hydrolyticus]
MIDLHSHILPGIDDGPQSLEQSLALVRAAAENGITHMVATPHIHPGRYPNTSASIVKAFRNFLISLPVDENLGIQFALAAEVRVSDELIYLASANELPALGYWEGDLLVLLEMPHSHIPAGLIKLLSWLAQQNIRPLIAHPERNKDIIRDFEEITPLVNAGCLFQVTAGALVGQFGEPARVRAEQILKRGLATVLATDTHHIQRRPPNLAEGRMAAEKLVGEKAAWALVKDNPAKIVGNRVFTSG